MIQAGVFDRTYTTSTTRWIVQGYSKRTERYVYPHQGWSWTEWKPEITDTYETMERARSAISGGYLKDMIERQEIVDIVFLEEVVERQIVEKRTVRSFGHAGDPVEVRPARAAVGAYVIEPGAYVMLANPGRTEADLYGYVESVRDAVLLVQVINGRWRLKARVEGEQLVVADDCRSELGGTRFNLLYAGPAPDASSRAHDYDAQMTAFANLSDHLRLEPA